MVQQKKAKINIFSSLHRCPFRGHSVRNFFLPLMQTVVRPSKITLFSNFRALWYVTAAATQKAFLEYQSDKEKIGFRLVPISCSISENMLSLLFYVLILCCCFISTLVQILSKMRYKIPNS